MQKYCLFHKYNGIDELYAKISAFIENDDSGSFNIYSQSLDLLWEAFRSYFENRTAAGGLLVNEKGEFLFIRRRDRWDIPKGHLSDGEDLQECARREIREETGLIPSKELAQLSKTYHIYYVGDKPVLKETSWFIFDYRGGGTALPQEEEDITEVRWFGRKEINIVCSDTWPSISDVINEALSDTWI
ncbi:MAG: NUDIX domain-containing protein [Bacteroidota bacterium]